MPIIEANNLVKKYPKPDNSSEFFRLWTAFPFRLKQARSSASSGRTVPEDHNIRNA
jgi:hypothetical protein